MVATSGLTFGHRWSGKLVIFHRDLSDVFAVLKGKSKNKETMHLIRVLRAPKMNLQHAADVGLVEKIQVGLLKRRRESR